LLQTVGATQLLSTAGDGCCSSSGSSSSSRHLQQDNAMLDATARYSSQKHCRCARSADASVLIVKAPLLSVQHHGVADEIFDCAW
jgi:hypothetical protein